MQMQKTLFVALAIIGTLTTGYLLLNRRPSQPELASDAVRDVYNQWKSEFKINVGASENDYRFNIFSSNYETILSHNDLPNKSFKMGLNAFAHLTQEEFAAIHIGFRGNAASTGSRNSVSATLPPLQKKAHIDWSSKMNPIRNQGQCGSSPYFGAIEALEGSYNIQKGHLYQLSVQEVLDCSESFGNSGCWGGMMTWTYDYIASKGGLATEEEYPYTATDGTCKTDIKVRKANVTGYVNVTVNSSDALKAALREQPVSIAIQADGQAFQFYQSGVITSKDCPVTGINHGASVVGYDDEVDQPYFKVRNQWGASWGEEGYIRLAIEDGAGVCGIQMEAVYPTV